MTQHSPHKHIAREHLKTKLNEVSALAAFNFYRDATQSNDPIYMCTRRHILVHKHVPGKIPGPMRRTDYVEEAASRNYRYGGLVFVAVCVKFVVAVGSLKKDVR